MKLKDYLETNGIKNKYFAEKLGVSISYLYALMHGKREPSLSVALEIEELTKGQVRAKDLRLPKAEGKELPKEKKQGKSGKELEDDLQSDS